MPSETTTYKSMMLSGVPNFVFAIGYTTRRALFDLCSGHVRRGIAA